MGGSLQGGQDFSNLNWRRRVVVLEGGGSCRVHPVSHPEFTGQSEFKGSTLADPVNSV